MNQPLPVHPAPQLEDLVQVEKAWLQWGRDSPDSLSFGTRLETGRPTGENNHELEIRCGNDFLSCFGFDFDTWLGEMRVRPRSTWWRRTTPWTKRGGGRWVTWLRRRLKVEILLLSFKAVKIASIWVFEAISDKEWFNWSTWSSVRLVVERWSTLRWVTAPARCWQATWKVPEQPPAGACNTPCSGHSQTSWAPAACCSPSHWFQPLWRRCACGQWGWPPEIS